MNDITHVRLTIDFDIWDAFKKESQAEIDDLIGKLRAKQLLHHCGNVRLVPKEGNI